MTLSFKELFRWSEFNDEEVTYRSLFRDSREELKEPIFRAACVSAFKDSLEDFAKKMAEKESNE